MALPIRYAEGNRGGPKRFPSPTVPPNFYSAAEWLQFLSSGLKLRQHHIAQCGGVCIDFRLQTLFLCGTLPSFVVFKFCFFERITIVVITAGHETFLAGAFS
jgi:hypothetical protein